ncbi:TetR/AcrR family transcriptional regulator [Mycolicibacterium psychrotolerans]|uniref:TetR/AcrR family transcriptional regulator n=1 Tax=Mycolicibacterium psychrotolerans TaxID=216929 RepID=UPI003D673D31
MASARTLFAERGYYATTINDIAAASRVSAGTVYQQCGGKQGLLRTLMDKWTTSDLVKDTLVQVEHCTSLAEVATVLSDSYLEFWRRYDDIVQLVLATAVHDESAAESLGQATARHRGALYEIARKVRTLGDFPDSFTDEDFADITLYHYGPQNGYHFTITVLGWPEDRAREFLSAQFGHSLRHAATN